MEKEQYYPSIKGAIALLAGYELLCPIIPIILVSITAKLIGCSTDNPLIYSIETISSFFLLILCINKKYSVDFKGMFSLEKVSIRYILPICLSILGLNIISNELEIILETFLPITDFWNNLFSNLFGGQYSLLSSLVAISIVAPIIEEILFRGIILRGFLMRYSVKKSIIVSALIFGTIHMNPWQFLGAFPGGIILGWLYTKTRSIVPCILAHALNNSLGFIILLMGLHIPGFSNNSNIVEHQPIWLDLIGVIFLVAGVMWLIKLFDMEKLNIKSTIFKCSER